MPAIPPSLDGISTLSSLPKMVKQTRSSTLVPQLKEVVRHLGQVQSALAVSIAALKKQNAELDEDVANVLQFGARDKLQDQVDRLEEILLGIAREDDSRKRSGGSPKRK